MVAPQHGLELTAQSGIDDLSLFDLLERDPHAHRVGPVLGELGLLERARLRGTEDREGELALTRLLLVLIDEFLRLVRVVLRKREVLGIVVGDVVGAERLSAPSGSPPCVMSMTSGMCTA